jgi:hypothetical protein
MFRSSLFLAALVCLSFTCANAGDIPFTAAGARSRPSPTSAGRNPLLGPARHAAPRYRLEFPKTFF